MIAARDLAPSQLDSALGRTSPILKLAIAIGWLLGLATTLAFAPPLVLAAVALLAGAGRSVGSRARDLARAARPAVAGGPRARDLQHAVRGGQRRPDRDHARPARSVPDHARRRSRPGIGLGLRVAAIGAVGAVFALTTDSTRLADSLVQQGRLAGRFAYGALAAYGAVPRFGEDLTTLRQARRIRGLRGGWHPRLLVSLLVLAIRHGDRMALAMDARGFGSGPRSRYRELRWTWLDLAVGVGAALVLVAALGRRR